MIPFTETENMGMRVRSMGYHREVTGDGTCSFVHSEASYGDDH